MSYHRPRNLDDALAIRAAREVAVIAGGTDVYPALAARRGWGDPTRAEMLDISAIPGLGTIEEAAEGWRIGCLVTWSQLMQATLPPLFDGIKAASREIGGAQVQNRGTIVGNLVTASPAGDGIPNLLALDARVELASAAARREVALADFLTGYRATALRRDEIVTAIRVPRLDGARSGFRKIGARRYLVISIVMAAGVIVCADGRITRVRLAVGACSAVAQRLPALEEALIGVPAAEAADRVQAPHGAMLAPIDDIRASARYRREAALTALRDLLGGFA